MVRIFDWDMARAQKYGFSSPGNFLKDFRCWNYLLVLGEAAIGFEFLISDFDKGFARRQLPGIRSNTTNKIAREKANKLPDIHRIVFDLLNKKLSDPVFVKETVIFEFLTLLIDVFRSSYPKKTVKRPIEFIELDDESENDVVAWVIENSCG